MNEKMLIKNLYDLDKTIAKPLLEKLDYPWEALPKIKDFIIELGKTLDPEIYEQRWQACTRHLPQGGGNARTFSAKLRCA